MQPVRSKHAILFIYYLPLATIFIGVSCLCLSVRLSLNLRSIQSSPIQRDTACTAEGNADLYGIGVRIGFYTQSLGSFISLTLKRKSSLANTYWLHIALLVAIICNSIRHTITPGQVIIAINLLYILFWFEQYISVGVVFDALRSNDYLPHMTFHMAVSTCLFLCMVCYSTWFWWRGLDILPHGECGDKAFFFRRVDLHGWFRTLGKCWNILSLIKAGLDLISIVQIHIRQPRIRSSDLPKKKIFFRLRLTRGQGQSTGTETETETDRHKIFKRLISRKDRIPVTELIRMLTRMLARLLARLFTSSFAKILAFMMLSSFSIIAIELGIVWNKLQSVNTIETLSSLGQLVPFIIGLGTFAEALWDFFQHCRTKPQETIRETGRRPADQESLHDAL